MKFNYAGVKFILSLCMIMFFSLTSFSQINIGSKDIPAFSAGEIKAENLELLKKSTTIFVYRDSDIQHLDQMKSSLNEIWTISKLEFASFDEFISREYDDSYSFITIGGLLKAEISTGGVSGKTFFWLNLWMNGSKDDEKNMFCRFELFPSFESYSTAIANYKDFSETMLTYLYKEATLYNWSIGGVKNALQLVNQKLLNNEQRWLFENESTASLKKLRGSVLYIPEHALIKFGAFTGNEDKRHDVKKLMKNYPYRYKVVSSDELSDLVLNSEKPVYYLTYVRSCTDKFIGIVDSKTGEYLYSAYSPVSYNIKTKDIKKIAKMMK